MHKVSESRTVNLIKNMLVQKQTKKQKTCWWLFYWGKPKLKTHPAAIYQSMNMQYDLFTSISNEFITKYMSRPTK